MPSGDGSQSSARGSPQSNRNLIGEAFAQSLERSPVERAQPVGRHEDRREAKGCLIRLEDWTGDLPAAELPRPEIAQLHIEEAHLISLDRHQIDRPVRRKIPEHVPAMLHQPARRDHLGVSAPMLARHGVLLWLDQSNPVLWHQFFETKEPPSSLRTGQISA